MHPPAAGIIQDPFGLTGTILDAQYRAEAVVGEGGFGVVYRGRHLSLDQPVAIKVLKGLDGGDPEINALVLEKFREEARLLYTLSQSSLHIVRSLDFGATTTPSGSWAPFMVLEWLHGRSLADDLDERRRTGMRGRSIAEALAILEPVVDGLSTAHRQQVAHRDVKPANVFLLAGGGPHGPRVKVLDFGIAKIMKEGEEAGTKGTLASFTWGYATPEQLDPRIGASGLPTDVYALGLVLTELLTDRAPVDTRDVTEIMKVATHPTERPTPRARGANVPDEIEAVCRRALAVDPRQRYPSIDEFWTALLAARDGAHASTTMRPGVSANRQRQVTAPVSAVSSGAPSNVVRVTPVPEMARSSGQGATLVTPSQVAPSHALSSRGGPPMSMVGGAPMSMVGGPPMSPHQPPPMSVVGGPPMSPQQPPPMSMVGTPPLSAGYGPPAVAPPPPSPPFGAPPPGPAVPPPPASSNAVVILTVIAFVLAALLAGSCVLARAAC